MCLQRQRLQAAPPSPSTYTHKFWLDDWRGPSDPSRGRRPEPCRRHRGCDPEMADLGWQRRSPGGQCIVLKWTGRAVLIEAVNPDERVPLGKTRLSELDSYVLALR